MKIICSTGSMFPLDTAHCFELIANAGFDGVELMCDHRFGTRNPSYIRKLSSRWGLSVDVIHSPFFLDLPGWDVNDFDESLIQTVELAENLGAKTVVAHLPLTIGVLFINTYNKTRRIPWFRSSRRYEDWMGNELAAYQDQTAVKIAVENLPKYPLTKKKRVEIARWNSLEEWKNIHKYLTLDTTHLATKGIDPAGVLPGIMDKLVHVHLSNFRDNKEHRLPDDGDLDLRAFIRCLSELNYSETLCLETHPDTDALNAFDDEVLIRNLERSFRFMKDSVEIPVTG